MNNIKPTFSVVVPPAAIHPSAKSVTKSITSNTMYDAPMASTEKPEQKPATPIGDVDMLPRPEVKKPSQYQVILLNDDYTPMDFVVQILIMLFNKSPEEAIDTMLTVHHKGSAVCGVYHFEVAETKVMQVTTLAREQEHPLRCTMEKKP